MRIAVVAFAVFTGGGLLALRMQGPPDPVYGGHPVSWWLANPRWEKVGDGERLIEPKWDARAVPFFIKTMETRDASLSRAYKHLYPKLPLSVCEHLPEPTSVEQSRDLAIYFIEELGPEAKPAIPALIRMLTEEEDDQLRGRAILALGHVGKNDTRATKALVCALKDRYPRNGIWAGWSLKSVAPEIAAEAGVQ